MWCRSAGRGHEEACATDFEHPRAGNTLRIEHDDHWIWHGASRRNGIPDAEAGRRSREAVSKKKTLERDRKLVREYSDLQAEMPGAKKKVLKGILCDRHGIPIDTLNKALKRGKS